jgi:hypothetical protein
VTHPFAMLRKGEGVARRDAPGRSLRMQMRQALLLGLSFNLYRLKRSIAAFS